MFRLSTHNYLLLFCVLLHTVFGNFCVSMEVCQTHSNTLCVISYVVVGKLPCTIGYLFFQTTMRKDFAFKYIESVIEVEIPI